MSNAIKTSIDTHAVCTISLDRTEKHNAFDAQLINELTTKLKDIHNDQSIRAVILTGSGTSFSSGADLNWMRSMANYDQQHNREDALKLAELLRTLYQLNQPTIARINGSAFGGALGLIACCDFAVSIEKAKFAFTEVKLGLAPAVISPYIVNAIGIRRSKQLFLTARVFDAVEAKQLGLIDQVCSAAGLDQTVQEIVQQLLQGGPIAEQKCKQLLQQLAGLESNTDQMTAALIAELRTSAEGQEGITAFLQKRKPSWLD